MNQKVIYVVSKYNPGLLNSYKLMYFDRNIQRYILASVLKKKHSPNEGGLIHSGYLSFA